MSGLVGYKLKQISSNTTIQSWGGVWNQTPAIPSIVRIPALLLDICAPTLNTTYGGDYILEEWYMEEPSPQVPESISDRQFFQQAAVVSLISKEEALEAVKVGTIPNTLNVIVSSIEDANTRFAAEMVLSGATVFYRTHPLVDQVRIYLGMTNEEIDTFFIDAGNL